VRPLGGKWRPLVEKVGEWYVGCRHLQGCSPRLCRLRTYELISGSKYWTYRSHADDMCPISLVANHQQKIDFAPPLHWLARERNWVRTRRSTSRRAVNYVGSPFLRSSDSAQLCWWLREWLLCINHVRYIWSGTIRGLSVECVWCVGQVFPCGVYNNSNHHDSQI
jgi:hypothetical protein